jgi:hypothetical protein
LHKPRCDQARLKFTQHCKQLIATKLSPQNWLTGIINAVQLKNVLGDIEANRGNLHVDGSFLQVAN